MHFAFRVKEAVCSQVPLIALPLFAEQPYAANNVAKQKIGLVLHKHHVTGQQMLEQANKVIKALLTLQKSLLFRF